MLVTIPRQQRGTFIRYNGQRWRIAEGIPSWYGQMTARLIPAPTVSKGKAKASRASN